MAILEDIFKVTAVDPDGKKFERGNKNLSNNNTLII
jgi:hypothetical protein